MIIKIPKSFMKDYNGHNFDIPIVLEKTHWRWYIGKDFDIGNERSFEEASPLMREFFELRNKKIVRLLNE